MRHPALSLALALAFASLGAGCAKADSSAGQAGAPLETRPPNSDYKPAFAGQTRAPAARSEIALDVTPVVTGLERPWALEFLPDGRMIITEIEGRMRIAGRDGRLSAPVAGLPRVDARAQGGLLDVAVDPDFARNQTIFFSYAEPREGGNGTALARARLVDGPQPRLEELKVIFRQMPTFDSAQHFGSRIVFAPDGTLFLGLGERSQPASRVRAQDLGAHFGKVVRINKDGTVPADNPFVGRAGVQPEIWSYGHRNIQSAALNPTTRQLWVIEHGPRGGDELNLAQAGKNYGWPVISYGLEYSGRKMPGGATAREGMEQPAYYWDPVIAPSGMIFYTGDLFPAWRNNIFVGGLESEKLVRLVLEGDRVVGEEWLLRDQGQRIRDVNQGPDGALYVAVDGGSILRITPKR
ncbi:PQQ-dependent sugar dehydrogenase [Phenylobacterium sp. LjRoot219]|uniref:PQQ-dependent sugar dehydrogenase n=1 Tax=Phenylobacterium sp. LjRoot219 TaxID=3342283 RepID=UPI003ECD591C